MNGSSFGINTTTPGSYAINVNGDTHMSGNIDSRGGNALYNIPSVDPGNYSNTYLTLKANIIIMIGVIFNE
jgi:hypothetical protein